MIFEQMEIVDLMAIVMIFVGFVTFLSLSFNSAPYGRYTIEISSNIFSLEAKKSWFIQECPSFIVPLFIFINHYRGFLNPQVWCLILFLVHYFQRTFVFPFLIRGGKPTHLHIVFLAFFFCAYNGYMQGRYLCSSAQTNKASFSDASLIIGSALFFFGLLTNLHSDHLLRNLRRPNESGYRIPEGGLFSLVSCANYFGEIVEWWGFAIASWSLPGLAFAVFTMANLVPRAMDHHRWYKSKFDNYPSNRRAIIPFLV